MSTKREASAIERVKTRIEDILPEAATYGNNHFLAHTAVNALRRLSTDPNKVRDLGRRDLSGMCGSLSYTVTETLFHNRGIIMDTYISNDPDSEGHVYHLTTEDGVEVLVDLSIGQFLVGHNHIFVGTRIGLRDLVLHGTNLFDLEESAKGKYGLYLGLDLPWRSKTRESAFRRIWGDTSRPYPLPIAKRTSLRED